MDLIPAEARANYKQAFVDLHDTFGKNIVVWMVAEEVIVSTDSNYNSFYRRINPNTQLIPQSGEFKARIKYLTAQEVVETIGTTDGDQKIKINLGGVRIRVSGDAVSMLNKAEKITFNDEVHTIIRRDRPHGLFDNDFYDYILQRVS